MNNLAGCCNKMMEFEEERLWLERVLSSMERVLGNAHPYTINSALNLALSYRRMPGGAHQAVPLFHRVIEHQRKLLEAEQISQAELATTLYAQTSCLIDLSQWAEVELMAREAELRFSESDPNNYRRFLNLCMLGESLHMQEQPAEAGKCLHDGFEGLQRLRDFVPDDIKPRVLRALEQLIQYTEKYGEADQLAKWLAEREHWKAQTN
jgi:hypothetical protein